MNVKEIFTIILLLEYKILNKNFEENIFEQAKSLYSNYNYLSKENFKKIKFWYEKENNFFGEMSKNNLFYLLGEENKIYEEEIKDLLFEINKDDLVRKFFYIFLANDFFQGFCKYFIFEVFTVKYKFG